MKALSMYPWVMLTACATAVAGVLLLGWPHTVQGELGGRHVTLSCGSARHRQVNLQPLAPAHRAGVTAWIFVGSDFSLITRCEKGLTRRAWWGWSALLAGTAIGCGSTVQDRRNRRRLGPTPFE